MDLFQAEGQSDERGAREAAALMRALAARYAVRGEAKLCLSRRVRAGLSARLDAAEKLRRSENASGTALALLGAQMPVIEACAARAAAEGGIRLPAWEGKPRLYVALQALCADDVILTRCRLTEALIALDALQPLTDAELWATPAALRIVISEALDRTTAAVVARAEQRVRADRWTRRPIGGLNRRDDVFLAQALKQAGREDLIGWGPECLIPPYAPKDSPRVESAKGLTSRRPEGLASRRKPGTGGKPSPQGRVAGHGSGAKHNVAGRHNANGRKTR